MIPTLFGDSAAPLYGVLHPAARSGTPRVAAVLCAPMGNEYIQSHRVIRNLAQALAERGIAALRFDYFGTGDSAGDGEETTLARMTADTREAIDEVRAVTGAKKVVLVALRGGALAAVPNVGADGVIGCVLWEPILHGARVLANLDIARAANGPPTCSLGGFSYSASLPAELQSFDAAAAWSTAPRALTVLAPRDDETAMLRAVAVPYRWIGTDEPLPLFSPGSQDLLHVTEPRLTTVVDAVVRVTES